MEDEPDGRWVCWKCGDLSKLDNEGLCRTCAVHARALERMEEGDGVLELYVLVARIVFGEPKSRESNK